MSSSSDLSLPPTTPFPVRVISIHSKPSSSIARGTRLITYAFKSTGTPGAPSELFGTWDSPVEGTVSRWYIKEHDVVSRPTRVVSIQEPCKHEIQQGGLCAVCGADMTRLDYTGFSDVNRASIQMTHIANGPTVSFAEAQRIERETAAQLRKARKLSLIVDLDQTIVHATVDPTVGEWISEGEAWEERHRKRAGSAGKDKANGEEDDSDDTVSDDDDEVNPNWEALKDVKRFRLGPESFGMPAARPSGKAKGKERALENQGCLYYVKPRPGWQEFLSHVATKYEMHVYTMGTRAYAEEVCAAIDPEGKFFGGRLLSRDESGSMTQKSLERLFPVDTSMVVIIDDRADVWDWGPNLVKVIPYDFFVGIGDINSTFLPKVDASALPSIPPGSPGDPTRRSTPTPPPALPVPGSPSPLTSDSTLVAAADVAEVDEAEIVKKDMLTRNSLALEAQVEERPLAKLQEELQEVSDKEEDAEKAVDSTSAEEPSATPPDSKPPESPKHHRKPLLKNDDVELERVKKILDAVHQRYYDNYDRSKRPTNSRTIVPRYNATKYDTRELIINMRRESLSGVYLVFSGVIALGSKPQDSDVWLLAEAFGARCSTEISRQTTHLRTVKVDRAHERGGIKIVWLAWFVDSIARWARQDETPYLISDLQQRPDPRGADTASSSPVLDANQISSDPEPDADDWDVEPGERVSKGIEGGREGEGEGEGEGEETGDLEEERRSMERLDAMAFEFEADAWADADREVMEAMAESDDEDEDDGEDGDVSEGGAMSKKSGNASDSDAQSVTRSAIGCGSVESTSRRGKRKRMRSITPLETAGARPDDDELLRSPLAKRKKIAADRRNSSKLKESIVDEERPGTPPLPAPAFDRPDEGDEDMGDEDGGDSDSDDGDGDDDDDDDFLARELEEEMG
ncbi:hypothetical protein FA95DRAFT_1489590 [Auriscalpium vulgare]|uniref:Uncharacterized protein n=1 Tax=Auriscalpium vulgare TaxID=40419 RepID=A0ACB8RZE2_9AGAM|nr:hypothetical protein FA95DRAFT_1489590 [Auriscalpium vulgare]